MALILVVDDDPHTTRLLEETVGLGGFSILSVTSALTGLELAVERAPAMLFLNVDMPDGRRVHEHLRRQPAFAEVPIALLGAGGPGAALGSQRDADFLLPKPITGEALAATLETVFGPGWREGAPDVGRWRRGDQAGVESPPGEREEPGAGGPGEPVDAAELVFEELGIDEGDSGTDPFGGGLGMGPPDPGPLRLRQDTQDFTARMLDEEELATREVGASFELERTREELAIVRRELAETQAALRREREERRSRDTGVQPVASPSGEQDLRDRDAKIAALQEALSEAKAQLQAHDGEALERALLERDREIEELEAKLQDAHAGAEAEEVETLRQTLARRDREVAALSEALDATQRELDEARLGSHAHRPLEGQTVVTEQPELLALAATLRERESELVQLRVELAALYAASAAPEASPASEDGALQPEEPAQAVPPPVPAPGEASEEVARLLRQLGDARSKLLEERTDSEELREQLRATTAELEETRQTYAQAQAAFQAQLDEARRAAEEAHEAAQAARAERDGVLSALSSVQQERERLQERAETAEAEAQAGAKLASTVKALRDELAATAARAEEGERAAEEAREVAARAQREAEEARERLAALREREEAARTERDAAAAKVWELEAALQERRHESLDEEARQAQTEAVISDLEARVEALMAARAEAEEARDRAEEAREAAARDAAQAAARAEEEARRRQKAERAREAQEVQLQALEASAAEAREAREARDAAEERLAAVEDELAEAHARVQALTAEAEQAAATRELLDRERERAVEIEEQLGHAHQRIELLEAELAEAAGTQEALQQALSKVTGLDAELTVAREQIAELETELAARDAAAEERAAAVARAEALEAELVASQQRAAELESALLEARDDAAQREVALRDATGARDRATERLDELEAELVASQQRAAELENTLHEARDAAVQREAELRDATLARDAATGRTAELEEQVSELDAERVALAERLAAEEAGRAALESELGELRRLREIEGLAEEARQEEEAARRRAEEALALTRESVERLERERQELEDLLKEEREAREFLDQRALELTQALEETEQREKIAASSAADERLDELQRLADQWRQSFYEQQAELEALRAEAASASQSTQQGTGSLQETLAQVLDVVDASQRAFAEDLSVWADSQRRIGQAIAQLWQIGMRFPQLQTGPMNINIISNEMKESLDNLAALLRRSDGYLKSVHDEVLGRMDD